MVIVFAVRFVVKYGKYGNDDWTLLAATVVAIAQHMTVLAGLTAGMGKSSSLMSFEQLQIVERVNTYVGQPIPVPQADT